MYPPVGIGQMRVSYSHDITLAGRLHIPAGTVMWVPHHAIQNVFFNWDDPETFLPGAPVSVLGCIRFVVTSDALERLQKQLERSRADTDDMGGGLWCRALADTWHRVCCAGKAGVAEGMVQQLGGSCYK